MNTALWHPCMAPSWLLCVDACMHWCRDAWPLQYLVELCDVQTIWQHSCELCCCLGAQLASNSNLGDVINNYYQVVVGARKHSFINNPWVRHLFGARRAPASFETETSPTSTIGSATLLIVCLLCCSLGAQLASSSNLGDVISYYQVVVGARKHLLVNNPWVRHCTELI